MDLVAHHLAPPNSGRSDRLVLDGVTKRFAAQRGRQGSTGLDVFDLRVGRGEAVGIIGPNGAGKSTVLRLAAGITAPSEGRIERSGRCVAVIELGAGVHPDLTGRENLELLFDLYGLGEPDERRSAEAVDFSGLERVIDRPVRHYSSGMLARLAFSAAVHAEPDLLLLDEVLSVGDLSFRDRCRERIRALRSAGTTILLVSHDLSLVEAVCDRTVLLVRGRTTAAGPTGEVVDQYLGRPVRRSDTGGLGLRLAASELRTGDEVVAEVDLGGLDGSADGDRAGPVEVRLEFVVPTHAAMQDGQGLSIVCGTARRSLGPGTVRVSLATRHLPPGRYELRASVEGAAQQVLRSDSAPFTLLGPEGPVAIRLPATVELDGTVVGGSA